MRCLALPLLIGLFVAACSPGAVPEVVEITVLVTQAPQATYTLYPTYTPYPTYTAVWATPPPTVTPVPPTVTLSPSPQVPISRATTPTLEPCHIAPIRGFGKVWDERRSARAYVGCPYYTQEKGMDFIAQRFQQGGIFWVSGPDYRTLDYAYVLFSDDATYIQVPVGWGAEPPVPMPSPTAVSTEPFEPEGNLAEVWREGPGVKRRLGLALGPERRGDGAWQEFSRGRMFWIPYKQGTPEDAVDKPFEQRDRWIYVLTEYWPYPPGGKRNDWLAFLDTWEE